MNLQLIAWQIWKKMHFIFSAFLKVIPCHTGLSKDDANLSLFCFYHKWRLMLFWQCGEGGFKTDQLKYFTRNTSKTQDSDADDDDDANIGQDGDNELWDEQSARECGCLRHQLLPFSVIWTTMIFKQTLCALWIWTIPLFILCILHRFVQKHSLHDSSAPKTHQTSRVQSVAA